jgi:hypothetical protein
MASSSVEHSFHPAKIFRRTGRASFAVQLFSEDHKMYMPGMIEIHCREVDWGYLARGSDEELNLERRLCKMGTLSSMIAGNKGLSLSEALRQGSICHSEGVTVSLGPYDPLRKAFVQCELKVSEDDGRDRGYRCDAEDFLAECLEAKEIFNTGGASEGGNDPSGTAEKRKKFRWCKFG